MSDQVQSAVRKTVRQNETIRAMSVPRVSVIVPTVNEAKNLPHVLPRIPGWIDEVILVDGNSTDGTVDVARSILPDIVVVDQARLGKGAALAAGFAAARGDILITLDADGSADPAEMAAFVGALLAGADFVKGSRFLQGGDTRDMEYALGHNRFIIRQIAPRRYRRLQLSYRERSISISPRYWFVLTQNDEPCDESIIICDYK